MGIRALIVCMATAHTNNRAATWRGMKWIRHSTRLAIYARDGFACVWCGVHVEQDGVTLTLDHCKPDINGGANDPNNLVTACHQCNSRRGAKGIVTFARSMSADPSETLAHIRRCRHRKLDRSWACEIVNRRRSFTDALTEATDRETT